tara:strand:+ start:141 stop:296 length:156 start_codon:yes stop_codon:yes gene_type:complete
MVALGTPLVIIICVLLLVVAIKERDWETGAFPALIIVPWVLFFLWLFLDPL